MAATASNPFPAALAPVLAVAEWFFGSRRPADVPPVASGRPASAVATAQSAARSRRAPPLRVVQVMEASGRPAAGRIVISGRMADVCAELDRLAAQEARREGTRTRQRAAPTR